MSNNLSRNVTLYESALNSVLPPFPTSLQVMAATTPATVSGRRRKKMPRGMVLASRIPRSQSFRSAVVSSAGMHGLGDFWSSVGDVFGKVGEAKTELEAKAQKLEMALKIIIGLSGVAALTGIANLLKR